MTLIESAARTRRTGTLCMLTLATALGAPAAHALDAARWQALAPALQAAVECRAKPDVSVAPWTALPRDAYGAFAPIKPPAPFTVFGLPVTEIVIFSDASGELGGSYTAELNASPAAVRKAANLGAEGGRTTDTGVLLLSEGGSPTITCTIAGEYDESDYQEN